MDSEHEQEDFYLEVMQELVDGFSAFTGEKIALIKARKAPIEITPDGRITNFYGDGKNAVDILLQQYEAFFGPEIAQDHAHDMLEAYLEDGPALPDRIRSAGREHVWERVRTALDTIFK